MAQLEWGKRVSEQFRARVMQICAAFNWSAEHANWLMTCMTFESGESFKPDVKNASGSAATGLILFMPSPFTRTK